MAITSAQKPHRQSCGQFFLQASQFLHGLSIGLCWLPVLWCEVRNLFFARGPWRIRVASFGISSIVQEVDPVDLSWSVARPVLPVAGGWHRIGSLEMNSMSIFRTIAALVVEFFLSVQSEPRRVDGEFTSCSVGSFDLHNILSPNKVMRQGSIPECLHRDRKLHE